MGRDYDPVPGQWYENLEEDEVFQVLTIDPDQELIEIQYDNGDIEELDLDAWHELDLERTEEPEGWSASDHDQDDEDWDDKDEDEDEDDWDEDDEDDEDDWDDDYDDYSDRE